VPHPTVINKTGFLFEALLLTDEEGVPLFVPCVQAVFAIDAHGVLSLVEKQPPINVAGQWHGDPAVSSLMMEPQIAFIKLATDIVLLGHAYPAERGAAEGHVGIRVGPVQKLARVYGNRRLVKRLGVTTTITMPEPFNRIPIVYERSFGGWDRRDKNPDKHRFEPRNPVGVGYCDASMGAADEMLLPNFEDPDRPYRGYGDTPPPVGFGFIAANWQPRVALAGTYDAEWDKVRKPLLPKDFDRRFFNAASPGLVAPGYLRGDEQVVVVGAAPEGKVVFNLPAAPAPVCMVEVRGKKRVRLETALDTVIVDMDLRRLTLIWRAHLAVRNGPHDILSVELSPNPDAPAPYDH
jgi:hypothetical protein